MFKLTVNLSIKFTVDIISTIHLWKMCTVLIINYWKLDAVVIRRYMIYPCVKEVNNQGRGVGINIALIIQTCLYFESVLKIS